MNETGARECLSILQGLACDTDDEVAELQGLFAWRDTAIAQLVATAGPVSEQASAVLTLLSELIIEMRGGMSFDQVARWRPEALLSPQDKAEERRRCLEVD